MTKKVVRLEGSILIATYIVEGNMNKKRIRLFIATIVAIWGVLVFINNIFTVKTFDGEYTNYHFDVKNIRLSTTIWINKEGVFLAIVEGNVFKVITDPLVMYDLNKERIARADDSYHFVAQDSHAIYVNNHLSIEMEGKVDFIGNTYEIYNENQEKIATAKFNLFNTRGIVVDNNDDLIADYRSNIMYNDFDVRISENSNIEEKALLMLFSSYYSDYKMDMRMSESNRNQ